MQRYYIFIVSTHLHYPFFFQYVKEHFISYFVFCSFVLPHNADEVGAFVEVERINHVGAAVRPADGVVGGDAQDACCLVHLEVHTVQVHTRLEHHHRPLYLVTQQGLRGDVHNLEHVPPHGTAVVVAVDALAGRGAQQRPQTLAYVLLVGGHPSGCAILVQCRRKTLTVTEECPVFFHILFYGCGLQIFYYSLNQLQTHKGGMLFYRFLEFMLNNHYLRF